jgi:hypothetical protein
MKTLLIILLLTLTGCAQHVSTETLIRDGVEYRSVVKQNLFLWYKTKAIDHRTDYSSMVIGDTAPDPNTASAIVEGAVSGLIRI